MRRVSAKGSFCPIRPDAPDKVEIVNKALAPICCLASILFLSSQNLWAETSLCLTWEPALVCPAFAGEVLPKSPELMKRQALSRLQDREWLSTPRMVFWPEKYPEEPIYYVESNAANQNERFWYHFEAGGVWQQLHWLISQPFLYSDEESGRGDLLLGLGLHSDFLREKIHSLTLGGVRLPTADSVVEPREFNQLLFAQKLFWQLEPGQVLYLGAGYIQKGEDQKNYDPGDVTSFDVGFVSPVTNRDFQLQGGFLMVWQSSDTFRDAGLFSRENRTDLLLGAIFWEILRLGLQWPLLTDSEFRQHFDRQPLGEVGFHLSF